MSILGPHTLGFFVNRVPSNPSSYHAHLLVHTFSNHCPSNWWTREKHFINDTNWVGMWVHFILFATTTHSVYLEYFLEYFFFQMYKVEVKLLCNAFFLWGHLYKWLTNIKNTSKSLNIKGIRTFIISWIFLVNLDLMF